MGGPGFNPFIFENLTLSPYITLAVLKVNSRSKKSEISSLFGLIKSSGHCNSSLVFNEVHG